LHTPSGRSDLILRSCLAVGRLCGRLEERRDAVSSRENACNGALAARPPAHNGFASSRCVCSPTTTNHEQAGQIMVQEG
jgi:hypothetical protein